MAMGRLNLTEEATEDLPRYGSVDGPKWNARFDAVINIFR